jgi:heptaprenyl diphosphate synthase
MASILASGNLTVKEKLLARFISRNTSPAALFIAGALLLAAFLFQQDLGVRLLQVSLYFLLCVLRGRRVQIFSNLLVGLGIVVFSMIIPTGRVIITVFDLPVTSSALKTGITRATTVVGMIAISQFAIRLELRFPGRLGGLVGRSLYFFQRIMADRRKVDPKRFIDNVDCLLLEIQASADPVPGHAPRANTSVTGFLFLSLL